MNSILAELLRYLNALLALGIVLGGILAAVLICGTLTTVTDIRNKLTEIANNTRPGSPANGA